MNESMDYYDSFSQELKLVLLCSQIKSEEENVQVINKLSAGPIDWDLFFSLAEHHMTYPLVYQCFSSLANSAVPDRVIRVLRQKVWKNTAKTLQMTGELVNVLKAMEEEGIRVVVLKGFPLGYRLYGNLALRPSRDLDILVWPEDVDEAIKVVEKMGYQRRHLSSAVTSTRLRTWMKTNHHIEYWHREREICLELHWRLGHYGYEIPLNKLENSLVQIMISGQSVYILGMEELLIFLILHGAIHAWFQLKWLCDVEVMLRQGRFSWDRLYLLSKHLGFEAMLKQALILAHHLLQAPVPDTILKNALNDQKAMNLVKMAVPFITSVKFVPDELVKTMPLYNQRKKYRSRLLSWKKRIALSFNIFLPTDRDMELILLPECFYFLYYLIRPFTWFGRKVMILEKR